MLSPLALPLAEARVVEDMGNSSVLVLFFCCL